MSNAPSEAEPKVTISLKVFLQILWGFKFRNADYRERAVPQDEVIAALEQIPFEIAQKHFKIVRPKAAVERAEEEFNPVVWSMDEWKKSGAPDQELRERCAKRQFAADKLTPLLVDRFGNTMGAEFCRSMALQIAGTGNFDALKIMGVSDSELEIIKNGSYEI